jgi:hypothetical protein
MELHDPLADLRIQAPCPRSWDELRGDQRKRFCSSCSLHVHNTAALTLPEARALLADPAQRVCLRIEYDEGGAPRFREGRWACVRRHLLTWSTAVLAAWLGGGKSSAMGPLPATPDPIEATEVASLARPTGFGGRVAAESGEVMGSPAPNGPTLKPAPKTGPKPTPRQKHKPKQG